MGCLNKLEGTFCNLHGMVRIQFPGFGVDIYREHMYLRSAPCMLVLLDQ
jgi:hypothetical protein